MNLKPRQTVQLHLEIYFGIEMIVHEIPLKQVPYNFLSICLQAKIFLITVKLDHHP